MTIEKDPNETPASRSTPTNHFYVKLLDSLNTLTELAAFFELVEETTNDEAVLQKTILRMRDLLHENHDHKAYFQLADYPSRLCDQENERVFLMEGFCLYEEAGGFLIEWPEELSRLLEVSHRNPQVRQHLQRGIKKTIDYAQEKENRVPWETTGINWFRSIESLIGDVAREWRDPVFYVEQTLDLLDRVGAEETDTDDVASNLIAYLRSRLKDSNKETLLRIWKAVRGKSIAGEYESSFEEITIDYEQEVRAINGLPRLVENAAVENGERGWFSEPNSPPLPIPSTVPEGLLPATSIPQQNEQPICVVVMGGIACGKTRIRHGQLSGLAAIDPADVYRFLTTNDTIVPSNIAELLQVVGRKMTIEAVRQRRNIVFEVIPTKDIEPTFLRLIDDLKLLGYNVKVVLVEASLETAAKRNVSRGMSNISCWLTEGDTISWLEQAIIANRGSDTH